jgi:hypothetical protein
LSAGSTPGAGRCGKAEHVTTWLIHGLSPPALFARGRSDDCASPISSHAEAEPRHCRELSGVLHCLENQGGSVMTSCKAAALALIAAVASSSPVSADEIRLIGTGAVRHTIEALATRFAAETGHKITGSFATAGVVTQRVDGGEVFDIVM